MAEVKSNKEYITSETSTISSSLNVANGHTNMGGLSFGSTTKCPSSEPAVVETFLACAKELFSRITADLADINSIGEGFATMDNKLKGQATKLSMDVKSVAIGNINVEDFEKKNGEFTYDSVKQKIETFAKENGLTIEEPVDETGLPDGTEENGDEKYTGGYNNYSGNTDSGQGTYNEEGEMTEYNGTVTTNLDKSEEAYYDNTSAGRPVNVNKEAAPEIESTVERIDLPEEPIEEEPIIPVIPDEEPVIDEVITDNTIDSVGEAAKKSSPLGVAAVAAGTALAGAAVYGATKYVKSKEENEDEGEELGGDEV